MLTKIGKKEKEEWLNLFKTVNGKDYKDCPTPERIEFLLAIDALYANFRKVAA